MAEVDKRQELSLREVELIRELAQIRKEKSEELEFEKFDGYELPPRTQFSMVKKPAVSIKYGEMTFNMACIRLFEGIKYILPIVNTAKKRMALIMCPEEDSASVEWARQKNGVWVNKSISSLEFLEKMFRMMNWNRECRYKVLGRVANSDQGLVMLFDLEEAIMFTPQPQEFTDPMTGEVKKKQVKFFPDIYKGRIGRSSCRCFMLPHLLLMQFFQQIRDFIVESECNYHPVALIDFDFLNQFDNHRAGDFFQFPILAVHIQKRISIWSSLQILLFCFQFCDFSVILFNPLAVQFVVVQKILPCEDFVCIVPVQFFLNALCMGLFCSQLPNLPLDAPHTVWLPLGLPDAFYKLGFLHHELDLHLERVPHDVIELFISQVMACAASFVLLAAGALIIDVPLSLIAG